MAEIIIREYRLVRVWMRQFDTPTSVVVLGQEVLFHILRSSLQCVCSLPFYQRCSFQLIALTECLYAWKHHSWNHIAAVLLFDFIPIVAHYIFVYTYYKQTIDPMHRACLLNERLSVTPAATRRGADRGTYAIVETNGRDHGMTTASF